jgi:alkaline phosphatase D
MDRKRRRLVQAMAVGSAATWVAGCGGGSSSDSPPPSTGAPNEPNPPETPGPSEPPVSRVDFNHGVASGDPLDDRVILWTRVTPREETAAPIPVTVTVARDAALLDPVARFETQADAEHDFCVKQDATGLEAGRWYYLSVYKTLAEHGDLDFVLHLGDYLYEYGIGEYGDVPDRDPVPPHEMVTLEDYRQRHAQYKGDADLRAVHQQYPMIVIWDDHESTNDSYQDGAENHQPLTEGDWETRKNIARRVYFEWMPVREQNPGDFATLYRRFQFGDLIDLSMLDTRLEGRDEPLSLPFDPARNDPERRLISDTQMQWLLDGLSASTARWRFIGQQVMFAQLNIAEIPSLNEHAPQLRGNLSAINMDQWDGYAADRLKILNHLDDNNIDNVVILTGDIHTSWANEIYRNPGSILGDLFDAPLATEFVTPAVTSPGFPEGAAELAGVAVPVVNPHIRYVEAKSRGFILMDVNHQRAQAEFYYARDIESFDLRGQIDESKTKLVAVYSGDSRLREEGLRPSRPRTLRTALFHPPAPASASTEKMA